MKTYLKSAIALSMLVFLAASCGKDKKKSSANCYDQFSMYSNPACYGNGIGGWNPLQPGAPVNTAAKAHLDTWFQQPNEAAVMPGFMGLIDFNFGGIQVGSHSDYCYELRGGSYYVGTYNKVSGTNYCSNMFPYSKATNVKLAAAMNGDNGTLQLVNVAVQGTQYILYYAPYVSGVQTYQQPVKVYVIDLSLHSMLNPVQIYEYGKLKESLVGVKQETNLIFR